MAAIAVPPSALVSGPNGSFFVWLYDPQSGRVSKRQVDVTGPGARGIMIADGLTDGDLVVAAGASQLQEGMQVRPLDQERDEERRAQLFSESSDKLDK